MAYAPTNTRTAKAALMAMHLARLAIANCTRPLLRSLLMVGPPPLQPHMQAYASACMLKRPWTLHACQWRADVPSACLQAQPHACCTVPQDLQQGSRTNVRDMRLAGLCR